MIMADHGGCQLVMHHDQVEMIDDDTYVSI